MPTTQAEAVDLKICVDCLQMIANGEGPEGHEAAMTAHLGEGADVTLGCLDPECDDDGTEGGFSWSSCDGCGSTLGGDRFHATQWVTP